MCPRKTLRTRPCKAIKIASLGLVGAFLLGSPSRADSGVALPAARQAATGPGQLQTTPSSGGMIDQVLVRVNGLPILHSDFETRWQEQLSVIAGQIPQAQIEAQLHDLRLTVLVSMVEGAMMEQRAEELGFAADANDIDRTVTRIREEQGFVDDELWRQALAQNGLSADELRDTIASNIVQQRMVISEIQRQVFVGQREIETYYADNIDQFTEPEQVLFQQLIFVYEGADRGPLRERAEAALAELRGGVSLSAVGAKYEDARSMPADSQGWIAPGDLLPEVKEAIDALNPLVYSDVVEGAFGFHILQLMDRKEVQIRPLEEAAPDVRSLLENLKLNEKYEEYTAELLSKAYLEIYSEEFADLESAWAKGNQGAPTGPPRQRR